MLRKGHISGKSMSWVFIPSDASADSPSELQQDSLHGVFALPLGKARELRGIDLDGYQNHHIRLSSKQGWRYLSGSGINAGQVHPRDKLQARRVVGVIGTTVNVYAVNSVLVDAL